MHVCTDPEGVPVRLGGTPARISMHVCTDPEGVPARLGGTPARFDLRTL
jgi:hypothetical protein